MYEFEKDLMPGETILYKGKPVPGKAKKNVGGLLVFVILCILIILVWAVVNKFGDDAYIMNAKTFFLGLIFMCGLGICQNIYNVFFKNNKIKDEYYCITNLRVMKYNKKKNKLVFGHIENYDLVFIDNKKGKYGDLCMQKDMSKQELTMETIMQQDPEDVRYILFSSIENPERVKKIFKEASKKLGKNIEEVIE